MRTSASLPLKTTFADEEIEKPTTLSAFVIDRGMATNDQNMSIIVQTNPQEVDALTKALEKNKKASDDLNASYEQGNVKAALYRSEMRELTKESAKITSKLEETTKTTSEGFKITQQQAMAAGYAFQDFASASGGLAQKMNAVTNNVPALVGNIGMLGPAISVATVAFVEIIKNFDKLSGFFGEGDKLKLGDFVKDLGTMNMRLKESKDHLEELAKGANKSAQAMGDYLITREKIALAEERITKAEAAQNKFKEAVARDVDKDDNTKERIKSLEGSLHDDTAKDMQRELANVMYDKMGGLKKQSGLEAAVEASDKWTPKFNQNGMVIGYKEGTLEDKQKLKDDAAAFRNVPGQLRIRAGEMVGQELLGVDTGARGMLPEGSASKTLLDNAYLHAGVKQAEKDSKSSEDGRKALDAVRKKDQAGVNASVAKAVGAAKKVKGDRDKLKKQVTKDKDDHQKRVHARSVAAQPTAEKFGPMAAVLYGQAANEGAGFDKKTQARLKGQADKQLRGLIYDEMSDKSNGDKIKAGLMTNEAFGQVQTNYNTNVNRMAKTFRREGSFDPKGDAQKSMLEMMQTQVRQESETQAMIKNLRQRQSENQNDINESKSQQSR